MKKILYGAVLGITALFAVLFMFLYSTEEDPEVAYSTGYEDAIEAMKKTPFNIEEWRQDDFEYSDSLFCRFALFKMEKDFYIQNEIELADLNTEYPGFRIAAQNTDYFQLIKQYENEDMIILHSVANTKALDTFLIDKKTGQLSTSSVSQQDKTVSPGWGYCYSSK